MLRFLDFLCDDKKMAKKYGQAGPCGESNYSHERSYDSSAILPIKYDSEKKIDYK
jgi:hypothetical protein